jgi:hypothetical protein
MNVLLAALFILVCFAKEAAHSMSKHSIKHDKLVPGMRHRQAEFHRSNHKVSC